MPERTSTSSIPEDLWPEFCEQIPRILRSQDPSSGRFGSPPFIITDQNAVWALAVAWGHERPNNPYFRRADLLEAIMTGGDALIALQDERGMFEFRKKDNSTWGRIYMPWTYSRWTRAWAIIRGAMPRQRRERWDDAISLGVQGIVDTVLSGTIRNIAAHDAMTVYCASRVLSRMDWEAAAIDFLHRTTDAQDKAGFWSEHSGPLVNYSFVYVDALGAYYAMSKDSYVLPALERAATFHANFTYPDGTNVETIDERNPYLRRSATGDVGFTFSPEGRAYVCRLIDIRRKRAIPQNADTIASILAYGEDGPVTAAPLLSQSHRFVLGDNDAMTLRDEPWFGCLSAYCCEPGDTRWIQDRQAFMSVFHDDTGVILTGGNTKLQPLWSTFTAGDTGLLRQAPGDEKDDFTARPGLVHLPGQATLDPDDASLRLTYGSARCFCRLDFDGPTAAMVSYELTSVSELAVDAHAAFLPHPGETWQTALASGELGDEPITLTAEQCGGWFGHHGWRVMLPTGATVTWPVRPHNPYTKDGSSALEDARIVITLRLGNAPVRMHLRIDMLRRAADAR